MLIAALDTSSSLVGLALLQEGRVLEERSWECGQNHTTQLLPALAAMLAARGWGPGELGAVVVALGPGSYSGLRVGLSTAHGLAFALRLPLVGVSTLEAQAYPHAVTGLPIYALSEAGRGEFACATYRLRYRRWRRLAAERLAPLDEICEGVTRRTLFCGELRETTRAALRERLGRLAVLLPQPATMRRAGYLGYLGWLKLQQGQLEHPGTVQPIYLRKPAISERKHL